MVPGEWGANRRDPPFMRAVMQLFYHLFGDIDSERMLAATAADVRVRALLVATAEMWTKLAEREEQRQASRHLTRP